MTTDTIRVLYVDDEPDLLDVARIFLEESGEFSVRTATSAKQALESFSIRSFDAIVSDYLMPGMDGIAFLKAVREQSLETPFILFTGRGREEVVIAAINNGADFYLQKGGDPETQFAELSHKIRQAVRRRQAEYRLHDSERRLADIIDFLPDATFAIDRSGCVIAWNRAIEEMTGVLARDMLGRSDYEYAVPFYGSRRPILIDLIKEPDERILQDYTNIYRTGASITAETDFPHPKGHRISALAKVCPLYNQEGEITGAIESIRDITERRQRDDEIAFKNIILSTQQETSLDGILIVDEHAGILNFNRQFARIWGIPYSLLSSRQDELLLQYITDKLAEPEVFLARVRYLYEHKAEKSFEEIALKDGRVLERFSAPMLGENGKYYGRVWYFRDITERKLAEENLKKSEARFHSLYTHMIEGAALHELMYDDTGNPCDYRIIEVNPSFEKHLGIPRETVIGKTSREAYHVEEPPYLDIYSRVTLTGTPEVFETYFPPMDKSFSISAYRPAPGTFATIFEDISKRKKTDEALRQANRQLSLLAGITRHDIINKITVVLGYLTFAEKNCTDPALAEYLKKTKSAIEEIRSQIEFTRVYQDLGTHEPRWIELDTVLPRSQVPASVNFITDVRGISVFADPMLEKVFGYLLENSVHHGNRVTEIRVSACLSDGNLTVTWEDNGIGIAAGEKEKIFEQGFGRYTGLGMFLAREILALTGMTITESGEPGRGARFGIRVPPGRFRPVTNQ